MEEGVEEGGVGAAGGVGEAGKSGGGYQLLDFLA